MCLRVFCLTALRVDNSRRKPIIGVLGGIASGKSTVAAEFSKLGCRVIDADKIGHELLDKRAVKDTITSSFGKVVLDPAGNIDRKKLADIVFGDAAKLAELNNIIHPLVLARVERLIERYRRQDKVRAIVLDMPLLVEVGWAERCDKLIFVDCKRELRAVRAKKMGIFSEEQLKMRENFQIPLDRKVSLADNTIDNNSGSSKLARQVAEIFFYIMDGE
ncbi:MAG: dephospho-CoA kinase [Planctomycetota bacterium]